MGQAMPGAVLNACSEQTTQRNATNGRNVRLQASEESSSVPDSPTPVDKGFAGPLNEAIDEAMANMGGLFYRRYAGLGGWS